MGKFWGRIVEKRRKLKIFPVFLNSTPFYPQVFPKRFFHNIRRELEFSPSKVPTVLILLFSFIILLFPNNLAKHFVLPQSYVLGVLVDYLSPALFLTEILVGILLIFSLPSLFRQKFSPAAKKFLVLGGVFLAALLPSVWGGSFDLIGIWRWLELALWMGFGFWVAVFIREKEHRKIFSLLGWAVLWVSLLALGQFLAQRSIFGYWFLGEPNLQPSLGGVALGNWGGKEVLRAYGTFPHPNVLGGTLSIILVWLAAQKMWFKFGTGLAAAVVSLSRMAWVSLLGGMAATLTGLRSFILWSDFSITRRWELLGSAWEMIKGSPLLGVGLGQFTRAVPDFGLPSGLSLFVQPVHNVGALIAAESGIPALFALSALFLAAIWETVRRRRYLLTVSLFQLGFLALFDHYLYTLPQGIFLSSLILGLSFSYSDS